MRRLGGLSAALELTLFGPLSEAGPVHIVYFGTYDLTKPRNRLILATLRERGHQVTEIHSAVWEKVPDKSQIRPMQMLRLALRWIGAYPGLLWRYWRAPHHDAVMIGYPGHLDVLLVWPFARWRHVGIYWDAFLSIYDTVVRDRRMVESATPLARLLFWWERSACRAADRVILDTRAHAEMFAELYDLDRRKLASIPVGVEATHFPRQTPKAAGKRLRVLFYGQFIPLHGVATIIAAASCAPDIDWVLIGTGQEASRIQASLERNPVVSLEWHRWIAYENLIDHIAAADVCLGIFGDSEKAARVIPNKIYQILASGRPLVTRSGPGIAELLDPRTPGVRLVPPDDPPALLKAIGDLGRSGETPPPFLTRRFDARALGDAAETVLLAAEPSG